MSHFQVIQQKLRQFIRKYYLNELIKGAILFFAIGGLYFLLILLLEYMLWLNSPGRTFLFWLFVVVEVTLFFRFILIPIGKLLQFHKGISAEEASRIIGNHFPEVNDKLLNLLQLAASRERSELLLAGIEQKSAGLRPIPFRAAVNFRKTIRKAKYMALPLLLILGIWAAGALPDIGGSYERVVNYRTAYEPPAPFRFLLAGQDLSALQHTSFTVQVKTEGKFLPETVQIHVNNEKYFMQNTAPGRFEYTFPNLQSDITFYMSANGYASRPYRLRVVPVPVLVDFQMALRYPAYTGKTNEIVKNTGNATVPEGTVITWHLKTRATAKVEFKLKDTTLLFSDEKDDFTLSRRFFNPAAYTISTSNNELLHYENLGYQINVIKDNYPGIEVTREADTLNPQYIPFSGLISDDYGLTRLRLVYYPQDGEENRKTLDFPLKASNFSRFTYTFPENIQLEEGVAYHFYFEVFDNDALRGGKSAKSNTFSYRKLTAAELEQQQLRQQQETIQNIDHTLKNLEEQEKALEEIARTNKEKAQLGFNEKRKLNSFLERQQQQEQLMQKFTRELQENLEDFQKEKPEEDVFKELLKERLERQQKELERNEQLMEELRKLADKMQQEDLAMQLEKLAKNQNNNKRNLEQLLELTKRYYVSAKAAKLQQDLEKMAKEQETLSGKKAAENTQEKQDELNKKFEAFQKEMQQLQEENEALKKPMETGRNEKAEEEVRQEQQQASENLRQQQQAEKARQHQQNAARKMKQMSREMQQQMQAGRQQQATENAEMLRQILDNLVVFSFEQEALLTKFDKADSDSPDFSKNLRRQHELRELFQHVDDSLFALSLRIPEVSETVNKEISEVYFNIDKALERLAETQVYQGVASQRYALTSANNLADFLSDVLDNMQQQMGMGSGQGNQPDMQLPDIIQSQEQLNQQMQDAMQQQSGREKNKEQSGEEQNGDNSGAQGEEDAEQLYEIYKEQQQLRRLLEQQLQDKNGTGENGDTEKLLKEMEQIEDELLEKGLNPNTLQRMLNLKHELLKLEDASFRQGKKQERESITNTQQFTNPATPRTPEDQKYFNQVEILNRQALPLHPVYKEKVETYFKKKDKDN